MAQDGAYSVQAAVACETAPTGTATRAVFLLPQAFLMVAMVRFVRGHAVAHRDGGIEAWRALRDTLVVTVVLATAGAIVVAAIGPTLLTLAFGPAYSGSGVMFVWLAAATVPATLASVLSTYHLARHSRLALVPWIGVCAVSRLAQVVPV